MFLLYFILWLIFVSMFTLESCIFGVVIAAFIFAFSCKFMDHSIAKELQLYRSLFGVLRYVYVLITEVVKANIAVLHMILSEEEELKPTLVSFHSELKTPWARAFMANAITLTPGTITVSLEEADYVVHCLDENLAEGIGSSVFAEMLSEMEAQ